jgi:hypothetical protein
MESQVRIALILSDLGRVDRLEAKFAAAAENFQQAFDGLQRMATRGNLDAWPVINARHLQKLQEDAEDCRKATPALGELTALRTHPPGEAIPLLLARARLELARGHETGFREAVCSLQQLEPTRPDDLYAQARGLGQCLTYLDDKSGANEVEAKSQKLRDRSIERILAVLNRAAALGFHDRARLEVDPAFASIREHQGYSELLARLKSSGPHQSGPGG